MDAECDALERRKYELLSEAAEIEVEQQRRRGMFKKVPHFSEIERIGRGLGQLLSRATQGRLANEVAAEVPVERPCPTCGRVCQIEAVRRTVSGIDGPIEMLEPKGHCPACRRDFFPSA
jgi:hypothetical protein